MQRIETIYCSTHSANYRTLNYVLFLNSVEVTLVLVIKNHHKSIYLLNLKKIVSFLCNYESIFFCDLWSHFFDTKAQLQEAVQFHVAEIFVCFFLLA